MKTLTPNIFVKDIEKTIEFYKKLGFELEMTVPDEGDTIWAMMSCGNVSFMFQTFESLKDELPEISRNNGGSLLLYIKVDNIQKFYDQIKEKVEIGKEMEKTFYGAKEFSIKDINDYILTFAEDEEENH